MARSLVQINVDLSLMVMDANGDYHPSGVMTFQYYVAAKEDFTANLAANCEDLMVRIYNDHYKAFREREPNDLNYISVVGVSSRIIDETDYPNRPWQNGKCPSWEESNLLALHADGYNKLSPGFFEALLKSSL